MKIQLTKAELDIVKKILSKHLPNATHYLFGSRVRGTAKQYSDLDVVIISDNAIPLNTLAHLRDAFSESSLPFKIDIVDWHRTTDEFRDHIRREWVKLILV